MTNWSWAQNLVQICHVLISNSPQSVTVVKRMGHAIIRYHSLTFLFQINACDAQVRLSTVSENAAIVLMVNFWNTRVWFYFTHSFLFTRWCINWPLLSLRLLSALTFKFWNGNLHELFGYVGQFSYKTFPCFLIGLIACKSYILPKYGFMLCDIDFLLENYQSSEYEFPLYSLPIFTLGIIASSFCRKQSLFYHSSSVWEAIPSTYWVKSSCVGFTDDSVESVTSTQKL